MDDCLYALQATIPHLTSSLLHRCLQRQQILDRGSDYALALKGDHEKLHRDVALFLDDPASKPSKAPPLVDAGHDRIETRTTTVSTDIAWPLDTHRWPGRQATGQVERTQEIDGQISCETAHYQLSAPLSPERLNAIVRAHWRVENRLRWRLDVVMNEDQDRSRLGNASQSLAVLRPMALNVMQKGGLKGALRGKIKRAVWVNAYLARLLPLFRSAITLLHEGCGNAFIWVNWVGTVQWLMSSSPDADAWSFTFISRGRYAASPV